MEKDPEYHIDLAKRALLDDPDAKREIEKMQNERAGIETEASHPENKKETRRWILGEAEKRDRGTPKQSR